MQREHTDPSSPARSVKGFVPWLAFVYAVLAGCTATSPPEGAGGREQPGKVTVDDGVERPLAGDPRQSVKDAGNNRDAPEAGDVGVVQSKRARLLPPHGKTLMIVGQDVAAIAEYVEHVWPSPAGVTTYTSLSETTQRGPLLEGLTSTANHGAGDVNASLLAARYPHAVLAVGLYMVDHTGSNLDHIANGTHDAAIDKLANFLKSLQRPVFLRVGYEFDGIWNHYDPEKYKRAFRHLANRMRPGNSQLAFVWQSATYGEGRYRNLPLDSWYPGDDVVDWFGSSYFKFASEPHQEMLRMARKHGKPLLIAEASPQGYDLTRLRFSNMGGSFSNRTEEQIWQTWFEPFFAFINDNQDVIRAVAYINTNWDAQPLWAAEAGNGCWGDSRVQANALVLEKWRTELERAKWLHGTPLLFDQLTAPP